MADATTTGNTETVETESDPQGNPDELGDAGKKALDAMKAQLKEARAEARAGKALQAELDTLKAQTMSETEKAIDQARREAAQEARTATLREVGGERVADAIRVASAGRNVDVDALLEGLDTGRFLGDDGQPAVDDIAGWIDRIAPAAEGTPPFPDLGQGARTDSMALNGDPLLKSLKDKLGIR
jgi:multidrug efflux pump subunit AcrA (membrane-fusion protein)